MSAGRVLVAGSANLDFVVRAAHVPLRIPLQTSSGTIHIAPLALIDLLASYAVQASAKPDAPGVYVDGAKIASLGLRIRNGRSFHGLALNVDMDLAPFRRINPCGYAGLAMTQLRDLAGPIELDEVRTRLRGQLVKHLDYAEQTTLTGGID